MHFSALLLLATTSIAAPFNASEGISVEANGNRGVKRDTLAILKGTTTEDRPPNVSQRNATGSLITKARFRNRNIRFTCEVEIGTRPKVFNLDIDTASSTTWVYGLDPKTGKRGWQRKVREKSTYNGKKSKTSKHLKKDSFREVYMDGTGAMGQVYMDQIRIAGLESKQTFGAAKVIHSRIVADVGFNGVLGLGKPVSDDENEKGWGGSKSFFGNVGEQLEENLFTLQMKADGGILFTKF